MLKALDDRSWEYFYQKEAKEHPYDLLEEFVDMVFEAMCAMAYRFQGFDDTFWMAAHEAVDDAFPSIGEECDGLNPFQQRLLVKIVDKLRDNMRGFYPALVRLLLPVVGPYERNAKQPNPTAANILRDALYTELKSLAQLHAKKPEKIPDYMPANVSYDAVANTLTHTYRGGTQAVTDLNSLQLLAIDLFDPAIRSKREEAVRACGRFRDLWPSDSSKSATTSSRPKYRPTVRLLPRLRRGVFEGPLIVMRSKGVSSVKNAWHVAREAAGLDERVTSYSLPSHRSALAPKAGRERVGC